MPAGNPNAFKSEGEFARRQATEKLHETCSMYSPPYHSEFLNADPYAARDHLPPYLAGHTRYFAFFLVFGGMTIRASIPCWWHSHSNRVPS